MKTTKLLQPGKPLQRKTPLARTGAMKSGAFARLAAREHKTVAKIKSRGMKGRAPTAVEKAFMDAIAGLGCIACAKDGHVNPWISLHHIDGRTKPGAHLLVLPLCAQHHQQDDTDPLGRVAVHGNKAQFEARYGSQLELLAEAKRKLGIEEGTPC